MTAVAPELRTANRWPTDAREESDPAGGAIQNGVPGGVGDEVVGSAGLDHDQAAADALADVVVGGPGQAELDPVDQEGPEALTGPTGQVDPDGSGREPVRSPRRTISPDRRAPMVRSPLEIGKASSTGLPISTAPRASSTRRSLRRDGSDF